MAIQSTTQLQQSSYFPRQRAFKYLGFSFRARAGESAGEKNDTSSIDNDKYFFGKVTRIFHAPANHASHRGASTDEENAKLLFHPWTHSIQSANIP
jgi:hypothetical protein